MSGMLSAWFEERIREVGFSARHRPQDHRSLMDERAGLLMADLERLRDEARRLEGDLSPRPPLRSGEGEDGRADRRPTNSLSAYLKLQASQRAHGDDISFARLDYAARWARQMEDRIGALRVALTAIATMEDVPAQEIATTALREDLAAAALCGRYPADGGEGGRGARTTEGATE